MLPSFAVDLQILRNRFCTNSHVGFYPHPAIAKSNISQQRPLPFPVLI